MGFWQDLTGESAADASRQAAQDTYNKQRAAIAALTGYGDTYAQDYRDLSTKYDPYVSAGNTAASAFTRLMQDPSSVRGLPGYQFAMDEGLKALGRKQAAPGGQSSYGGPASKDFIRFATGTADKTYGDQFARLLAASQFGQSAVGAQNATVGAGLGGQLQTRLAGYGGDMTAANTIGLGNIAAANAQAAGSQNLLNTGVKLAGMALGVPSFGMPSFGGGQSSYGGTPGAGTSPAYGGANVGYDQFGRLYNWGG